MGAQHGVLARREACTVRVCIRSLLLVFEDLSDCDLFISSADKTMKVWDIGARAAVSTIQDTGEVWSVCWRPLPAAPGSAGAFASGGEDSTVKLWRSAGTS